MTRTIADLVSFIHDAERRLADHEPDTEAWLAAQRVVIHARAAYWNAMGEDWDARHPRRTHADRPDWRW